VLKDAQYSGITNGNFNGVAYVGENIAYNATGGRASVQYYSVNPSNPGGPLIVLASQTYGANGEVTLDYYNNTGVLTRERHNFANGTYDTHYYGAPGVIDGISYASYDAAYNASGQLTNRTYYDASDNLLATQAFTSTGFAISVGGTVIAQKVLDADGNYETTYNYAAGQPYQSTQVDFTSAGVKIANSFDVPGGTGQLNLFGANLVASTAGTIGPSAAPGDFVFTPHSTSEIYNFFSTASNDIIDFTKGFGTAIVKGFTGANAATDVLNLTGLFSNLAAAEAATSIGSVNTTITAGTDVITLVGVTGALTATQMGFS
jgi:hypothetical protein